MVDMDNAKKKTRGKTNFFLFEKVTLMDVYSYTVASLPAQSNFFNSLNFGQKLCKIIG